MNEWLKKFSASFKEKWAKWSVVQKAILGGIIVAVIVAIVLTARIAHKPTTVPLFNTAISDQTARDNIKLRLDQEGVSYTENAVGVISVENVSVARRMRRILLEEDLVPTSLDPYALFDVTNWSITDFERNINNKRAIERALKQHIETFDPVASANVIVTLPPRATMLDDQDPTEASVILNFKPGATMTRKQLQGVQNIIKRGVQGLTDEHITITDRDGNLLNDFDSMEDFDNVSLVEKEQKLITNLEKQYRAKILGALQQIYDADRVRDLNLKIEMSFNRVSRQTHEILPSEMVAQDPDKPYDTRVYRESLPVSEQMIENKWTGTGYNPEGPAGVEGQNPPVYSDMSNVLGQSTSTSTTRNYEGSFRDTQEEVRPSISKVSVSVSIDSGWNKVMDNGQPIVQRKPLKDADGNDVLNSKGKPVTYTEVYRERVDLSQEDIEKATRLVQGAIGYDRMRGDTVVVENIQIDRTRQFAEEDAAYFKAQQTRRTIMWALAGIIIILVAFITFRFISRELERRRRLREEELLRKQQAERERQLWEAKNEGMEVTMSVEERKRAELQENAIAMAKEHPEDVAMLIRTWMMEE